MREWSARQVARAAGARLVQPAPDDDRSIGIAQRARSIDRPLATTRKAQPPAPAHERRAPGPLRAVIDSRAVETGDLFVGLPGVNVDGGRFAAQALADGAWGVLVAPGHAEAARCAAGGRDGAALLAADDPLAALQRLATAWRYELDARVIGITGSTGKTSTKDVLTGMLAPHRAVTATRANYNTEIGLPLTVLEAPPATDVLILEMAMRGQGQIAELAAIARPDVGVVVNVGPVHLEQLGSIEGVADEKAALLGALLPGGTAVVPAGEALLEARTAQGVTTVTFGPGGDVDQLPEGLELGFASAHMHLNALAALAAARAVGVEPAGRIDVALSALRGQRLELPGGVVVIDDCYNANPMSMRAALDDLAATAPGRRVAVLGDMLELGGDEAGFHRAIGEHARERGVGVLVTVGPRAAAMGEGLGDGAVLHATGDAAQAAALVRELVEPGDTVLVKGSRGVGLEVVARTLAGEQS
ncbi:MAG: UDP-N-acetylmuramoyl-tripeptide--D-alanyl-D-alanine ligase [Solirubrobacterales bacterium]|nr:UDP-N-acetylmuramoyl-tripeptide--D-alanyl-D-alanine ligase [Solirubrobacterales bacterium]MBA3861621.1 UDP-N-acetylmuramoyl-tripeptide--D-alanyl-D-alanine ligase [Solirubrobacterales bacterium]